jgi:hypothetical protein
MIYQNVYERLLAQDNYHTKCDTLSPEPSKTWSKIKELLT